MLSTATDVDVRPLSRLFRALGDETRLRIVGLLVHGELCVCHLEHALALSQPNASRQLGILRAAGIVDSRRDGSWVHYRLVDQDAAAVRRVFAALTRSLAAEPVLAADHARVRRRCGPASCR